VQFECGWKKADSPLPQWMKPSNAKVIVLFDQYNWRGMPVDVAVPVGRRIPPRALTWLKRFAEMHGRPLLYAEQIVEEGNYTVKQSVVAHGPVEFRQEFAPPAKPHVQPALHEMPFGAHRQSVLPLHRLPQSSPVE
jgi:hypothetical protein